MITALEMIHKITWSPQENKSDYKFTYMDFGVEKTLDFEEIVELDAGWFVLYKEGRFSTIPTHRIRKFIKNDEVVWSRSGLLAK